MFCLPYLRWKHPEWERPIKVRLIILSHSIILSPGEPYISNHLHHLLNPSHPCTNDGFTQRNRWKSQPRIFQLIHRHRMCHHCQWNPRLLHPCVGLSFEETGLSTAILRSELAFWQNTICFPPSQHNNRVAEAVCGGDAGEKIGLKFNEHCTTWSRCTRWQIILAIMSRTWINLPISGKNSVSQTWHENLSSFQGCFPTNSGTSKLSIIKLVNCRTYQWQTFT